MNPNGDSVRSDVRLRTPNSRTCVINSSHLENTQIVTFFITDASGRQADAKLNQTANNDKI